jgi:chaperone required for assembly of F1-ATPase
MKRFWQVAAMAAAQDGYRVLLDGRPVRLPGGAALVVPARGLAEAITAEWNAAGTARGGAMDWNDVPLTRLAGTAQERIAPNPQPVARRIAQYGETDLLCYRAEGPEALVQRQHELWSVWLDWVEGAYGAKLKVTTGVMPVAQDPEALAALGRAVADKTPAALAALGVAVPALGSLVLGLALAAFRLDAARAWTTASVDEDFQAGLWGRDEEGERRRCRVAEEVAMAERFLRLAG